jgi:hypothetical protein
MQFVWGKKTAQRLGVSCTFVVADVLGDLGEIPNAVDGDKYIRNVWKLLMPVGLLTQESICDRGVEND